MEPILLAWELANQCFWLTMGFDDSPLHQQLSVCGGTFGQIRSSYHDAEPFCEEELAAAARRKTGAKGQEASQKFFAEYIVDRTTSLRKEGHCGNAAAGANPTPQGADGAAGGMGGLPIPLPHCQLLPSTGGSRRALHVCC